MLDVPRVAHLASGRRADAEEASQRALVAAGHVDPFIEGAALGVHIDVMGGSDAAATTREVDRHAELSRQIGAPSVLAMSAYIQARNLLASQDSSHSADALRIFQNGLALARESGAVLPEALNLQGVARVAALLDVPEAGDVCRDAIARFYETRNWTILWQVLDYVASWSARNGDIESASVLYGHLDEYHPPWGSGPDRANARRRRRNRSPPRERGRVDERRSLDEQRRPRRVRPRPTRADCNVTRAGPFLEDFVELRGLTPASAPGRT